MPGGATLFISKVVIYISYILHSQSYLVFVHFLFTFRNLLFFFKCSRDNTVEEVAPEDTKDEGAGEEEVEYGDSHFPYLEWKA